MTPGVSSFLTRYSAVTFLYVVGLIFGGVLVYQIVTGQPLNQYAVYYLSLAILQASHTSGVQQGVETTNDTVGKVAAVQYPLAAKEQIGPTGPPGPPGPPGDAPTTTTEGGDSGTPGVSNAIPAG